MKALFVGSLLCLGACSAGIEQLDGSTGADVASDSGPDGGTADAGPPDAGPPDGGSPDGGSLDGGSLDGNQLTDGGPLSACTATRAVGTVDELVTLARAIGWQRATRYAAGAVNVSTTLVASTELVVLGSTLGQARPQDCVMDPGCAPNATFILRAGTSTAIQGLGQDFGYQQLRIPAGAQFRLSFVIRDTHPSQYSFRPQVEVHPPCGSCPLGQLDCASDRVCYDNFTDYCLRCDRQGPAQCACSSAAGPLPEGEMCSYQNSGDTFLQGTCGGGRCN